MLIQPRPELFSPIARREEQDFAVQDVQESEGTQMKLRQTVEHSYALR
jgi:hypothetical protein